MPSKSLQTFVQVLSPWVEEHEGFLCAGCAACSKAQVCDLKTLGTANNWRKCESSLEDKGTSSGLLLCQGMEKIYFPVIPTQLLEYLPLFIDCSVETNQPQGVPYGLQNGFVGKHWKLQPEPQLMELVAEVETEAFLLVPGLLCRQGSILAAGL